MAFCDSQFARDAASCLATRSGEPGDFVSVSAMPLVSILIPVHNSPFFLLPR